MNFLSKRFYQVLLLLVIVLFSLGQLQRIQLTPAIGIYAFDIIIIIWLISSLSTHTNWWRQQWLRVSARLQRRELLSILILILSCWVVFGLVINAFINGFTFVPWLYLARLTTYTAFALSVHGIAPFTHNQLRQLWLGGGLLILLFGTFQYLFLPDTRFLRFLGWDDHYYRLISTIFDPNFTGIILVMTVLQLQRMKHWPQSIKVGLSIWLTAGVALTYSRASYLSFGVAAATVFLWQSLHRQVGQQQKKNWLLPGLTILLAASLTFLPQPGGEGVNLRRTYSISSRQQSVQSSFLSLQPYQWVVGKGAFTPKQSTTDKIRPNTAHFPDNLVAFLISTTGIVGSLLTIAILGLFAYKLYLTDPYQCALLLSVLAHSQFNHTLFQPFTWLYLLNLTLQ